MKNLEKVKEAHLLMHAERVSALADIKLNDEQAARLAEAGIVITSFAHYYIADMHWVFRMSPAGYITGSGQAVIERGPDISVLGDGTSIATSAIQAYFEAQRFIWEGRDSWEPRSAAAYKRNRKHREGIIARFARYQTKLDSLVG